VEYHFKTNNGVATVELMFRCSKWLGPVVPFVSMKGTTVTRRKEHQLMSFLQKCQKQKTLSPN
jgi:hypothetical protein